MHDLHLDLDGLAIHFDLNRHISDILHEITALIKSLFHLINVFLRNNKIKIFGAAGVMGVGDALLDRSGTAQDDGALPFSHF